MIPECLTPVSNTLVTWLIKHENRLYYLPEQREACYSESLEQHGLLLGKRDLCFNFFSIEMIILFPIMQIVEFPYFCTYILVVLVIHILRISLNHVHHT